MGAELFLGHTDVTEPLGTPGRGGGTGGLQPLFQNQILKKYIYKYTGCNRRNGPDFGRVFLMLNYTEKPQNTYIQSSMVTEI